MDEGANVMVNVVDPEPAIDQEVPDRLTVKSLVVPIEVNWLRFKMLFPRFSIVKVTVEFAPVFTLPKPKLPAEATLVGPTLTLISGASTTVAVPVKFMV
jgi:hypothetical protein